METTSPITNTQNRKEMETAFNESNLPRPASKIINPNTPDSVSPANRIGINRYIGEDPDNIARIEQTILANKSVLIDAPTSSGKSKIMGDLFYKWVNYENRRCYFLLPKIIQQHQFQKTYLKGFPMVNAETSDEDREMARLCGGSITWQGFLQGNYDSGMTERDIVIIDEVHLLVNNQSYIAETKHLIRKLLRGNYKIVLLTATSNYMAFQAIFSPAVLSFYYNDIPPRHIKPMVIDGRLMPNVQQYIRTLDFSNGGLHIVRINDKEMHTELVRWAVESLGLEREAIQVINRDIADQKFRDADYVSLLENETIPAHKKLLITTIFSDEGININNNNITSFAIFFNPKQILTSQRCRDSVIQFVSRFRYLNGQDRRAHFTIKLFLPELPPDFESHDYFQVLQTQKSTAKYFLWQLIDTRNKYGRLAVMHNFPMLLDGTDQMSNLVVEVADGYFAINEQGVYFNAKNSIDQFKSNEEFLGELAPYFTIEEIEDFNFQKNINDARILARIQNDRMNEKVEALRKLKENPTEVLHNIAHSARNPHLQDMLTDLKVDKATLINGTKGYSPFMIKSVEEEALRLCILNQLNFPSDYFAGLLLHKREYHTKIFFLRFLLSREMQLDKSMDNLYYLSVFKPLEHTINEVFMMFMGKEQLSKEDVKRHIRQILPHDLKTKKITADQILDELFETEEKRFTENGKKRTYVSVKRRKTLQDIVADLLYLTEQHYPTLDGIKMLAGELTAKKSKHSQKKRVQRAQLVSPDQDDEGTLAKARLDMDKASMNLRMAVLSDPAFIEKVNDVSYSMSLRFRNKVEAINREFGKLNQENQPAGRSIDCLVDNAA